MGSVIWFANFAWNATTRVMLISFYHQLSTSAKPETQGGGGSRDPEMPSVGACMRSAS